LVLISSIWAFYFVSCPSFSHFSCHL
jgi:hypothetical protein